MNLCMCGCGQVVGGRFALGHNGDLLHRLYEAELAGESVEVYGEGRRPSFYAASVGPIFSGYFQELVAEAQRRVPS